MLPPLASPPTTWETWVEGALQLIYVGQQALATQLGDLMPTVQELQAALDRNTKATADAATAIQTEIKQLKDAIEALSTATPPTQAQLDQLNAASDKLDQATSALGADDPTV